MPTVIDGSTGVTMPAGGVANTAGAAVGTTDTQTLTNKTIQGGALTRATAQASTSGTFIDFTGIPSWVKRITVMFDGVSTNGTSNIACQIGASSAETTGYTSGASQLNAASNTIGSSTTAFVVTSSNTAASVYSGILVIVNITANTWVFSSSVWNTAGANSIGAGTKTTSGALGVVRIATGNGTDTFDAGTINIMYEG